MAEVPVPVNTEKGCCSKSESKTGTCKKKEAKSTCSSPAKESTKKTCSKPQETTCVCTCLFQYNAPAPVLSLFQPAIFDNAGNHTGYLQQYYTNPHLAAPWQPPDLI